MDAVSLQCLPIFFIVMEKLPPAYVGVPTSTAETYPPERSKLCDVCQGFDVAELLSRAENQVSTTMLTALDGVHTEEMEFKAGMPLFFEHYQTLKAVEESADFGCALCSLIWACWSGSRGRSSMVDRAIDDSGQGQVFIGTSGFNVSKAEMPLITVTQRPDGTSSRTLCTFDVYAPRGRPIVFQCVVTKLICLQILRCENHQSLLEHQWPIILIPKIVGWRQWSGMKNAMLTIHNAVLQKHSADPQDLSMWEVLMSPLA